MCILEKDLEMFQFQCDSCNITSTTWKNRGKREKTWQMFLKNNKKILAYLFECH